MSCGDNIPVTEGSYSASIAADCVADQHYQRVKPCHGGDGVAKDTSPETPMPVIESGRFSLTAHLNRYLDSVGDGSGTKNAIGDYSVLPLILQIAPPSGKIYRIRSMIFTLEDDAAMEVQNYGGLLAPLTNGLLIRVQDATSTLLNLTDGLTIKSNGMFALQGAVPERLNFGAGNNLLVARRNFMDCGMMINLNGTESQKLQVVLSDDFTGLISHYVTVQGFSEDV